MPKTPMDTSSKYKHSTEHSGLEASWTWIPFTLVICEKQPSILHPLIPTPSQSTHESQDDSAMVHTLSLWAYNTCTLFHSSKNAIPGGSWSEISPIFFMGAAQKQGSLSSSLRNWPWIDNRKTRLLPKQKEETQQGNKIGELPPENQTGTGHQAWN